MFAWESLSALLASRGFRVLRYDHPGRGLSDRPRVRYNPALYGEQLWELTEQLKIDRMQLVGWSMGCVIAGRFALQKPERVASLTLIAPALFVEKSMRLRLLLATPFGRRVIVRGLRGSLEKLVGQHLLYPERFADYQARMNEQLNFPGVEESFVSTLQNFPWRAGPELKALADHPRPTLVIWGDQDQTTPYRNADAVFKLLPRAKFLRIAGARHGVHLDHPDRVYPALLSLLGQAPVG
jgi:pimeloyl-ACP methyl ester carboxylesterase